LNLYFDVLFALNKNSRSSCLIITALVNTNFVSFMPYCHPEQRTRILRTVCFKTNFWLGVTQITYVVSDDERDISLNKVIIGVIALVT